MLIVYSKIKCFTFDGMNNRLSDIHRITGLLFESIILAFIIGYSWTDATLSEAHLDFKAVPAAQIILRSDSDHASINDSLLKLSLGETSTWNIVLNNHVLIKSLASLSTNIYNRNPFYVFIAIKAP